MLMSPLIEYIFDNFDNMFLIGSKTIEILAQVNLLVWNLHSIFAQVQFLAFMGEIYSSNNVQFFVVCVWDRQHHTYCMRNILYIFSLIKI